MLCRLSNLTACSTISNLCGNDAAIPAVTALLEMVMSELGLVGSWSAQVQCSPEIESSEGGCIQAAVSFGAQISAAGCREWGSCGCLEQAGACAACFGRACRLCLRQIWGCTAGKLPFLIVLPPLIAYLGKEDIVLFTFKTIAQVAEIFQEGQECDTYSL